MATSDSTTQPLPLTSPPSVTETFKIGTRSSRLAIVQTEIIQELLNSRHPGLSLSVHPTSNNPADVDKSTALSAFNAKALWTSDLEADLISGALDLIVHSCKDMPTQLESGCALGAILGRTERRDAVVMNAKLAKEGKRSLKDLKEGDVVGTSSVRRSAQLRKLFPHLKIRDMRGNVHTRIRKLDDAANGFACLILAAAGVQRLGLGERLSSYLGREDGWYSAVGQGAIGVEIREGDERTKGLMGNLIRGGEVKRGFWEGLAERSCLRTLEGGCSVPVGVDTEWEGASSDASADSSAEQGVLLMFGTVVSVDGTRSVSATHRQSVASIEDADEAGLMMAKALIDKGAGTILEEIVLNRKIIAEQGHGA
ncbi:porphobilinogen deaminase [Varicellaria rhodocarpa]|nr:porphobilinogen deaminase [Varicellaria rhodocarpa]